MSARVVIRRAAKRDLDALTDYFLNEADTETAGRFVEQARTSFLALAETSGLGPPVATRALGLSSLRKWRVDGFPKVLIFYEPIERGVRIVRILHSAADWWSLVTVN